MNCIVLPFLDLQEDLINPDVGLVSIKINMNLINNIACEWKKINNLKPI